MKTKILPLLVLLCTVFASCKKDDEPKLSIDRSTMQLYSLEEQSLMVSPSSEGCSFESENDMIARVTSSGKITGLTIGQTKIVVTNPTMNFTADCNVTVRPKYNLFAEPLTDFGATKAQIKSKEKRVIYDETSTSITYRGENPYVTGVVYLFDANGKMTSSSFMAPAIPTSNVDKLLGFITERYYLVDYDMSQEIFFIGMRSDKKVLVGLQMYQTNIMSIYVENTNAKSQNLQINKELTDLVDKLL